MDNGATPTRARTPLASTYLARITMSLFVPFAAFALVLPTMESADVEIEWAVFFGICVLLLTVLSLATVIASITSWVREAAAE